MYEYNAVVSRVVDGDTVEGIVDLGFGVSIKRTFRLYGINAPETRTKVLTEKELGIKAKNRLKELVEGKSVVIKTILDSTEKFGRYLAVIYLPVYSYSINKLLLDEGLVVEYFGGKR